VEKIMIIENALVTVNTVDPGVIHPQSNHFSFLVIFRLTPRFFAGPGRSEWSDGSFLLCSLVLVFYPPLALSSTL